MDRRAFLGVAAARVVAAPAAVRAQPEGKKHRIEHAFSRAARSRAGGVLMVADAFLWSQRGRIVALAARQRIPVIYPEVEFVEVGGLMGYGPNVTDNFRRAAVYVDKILRSAKPADLPVEQPTTFELVINLTTAKALAPTIPPSLLARADVVIQ